MKELATFRLFLNKKKTEEVENFVLDKRYKYLRDISEECLCGKPLELYRDTHPTVKKEERKTITFCSDCGTFECEYDTLVKRITKDIREHELNNYIDSL